MGQPDGVTCADKKPLILQCFDDRLFGGGQQFAWYRPGGREAFLAQGDKTRQQMLEDWSLSGGSNASAASARRMIAPSIRPTRS